MSAHKKLWIGTVEVVPRRGVEVLGRGRGGAVVNAIAKAASADGFRSQVLSVLDQLGLDIEAYEGVEPFLNVSEEVQQSLIEVADAVEANNEVGFGPFHTYPAKRRRGRRNQDRRLS